MSLPDRLRLKDRWLWVYLVLEVVRHEVAQVIVPPGKLPGRNLMFRH
jgi:hypothetical protein